MHPEDIEDLEDATPGERIVFRFLHEAARAGCGFIAWHEPAIGEQGKEPDSFREPARPPDPGSQGLAD